MAKKQTKVEEQKQENPIIGTVDVLEATPVVNFTIPLGMKDVISVEIAKEERTLEKTLKTTKEELRTCKNEVEDARKKLDAGLIKPVKNKFGKEMAAAVRALKNLGFCRSNADAPEVKGYSVTAGIRPTFYHEADEKQLAIFYSLTISTSFGTLQQQGSMPVTKEVIELNDKLEERNKAAEIAAKYALAVRKDLQDLPKRERQYIAQYTEGILSSTEKGKKILASMSGMTRELKQLKESNTEETE